MTSTTSVRRVILVVLAAGLLVTQEVIGYRVDIDPENWSLSRTIVHTFAGLSFAVCAWLAWQAADSPIPGRIMILIAFIWLPPPFIAATWGNGAVWPVLESIGLFWAVLQALLVAVYPNGRFQGRVEKWVLIFGFSTGILRIIVTLLCYQPDDGLHAPNVYAIFPNNAVYAIVDNGFRLAGVLAVLVIVVAVFARWVRGSTPARSIAFLMPVALLAWTIGAAYVSVVHLLGTGLDTVLNYISLFATASLPISFVAGLMFIRSLRGRVSDLMVLTRDGVDRDFWQGVLAETLRDPDLQVYWWDAEAGRYLDALGNPVPPAPEGAESRKRAMMAIDSPDGRLALIDHDIALSENTKLLDAVSTALRLSVDNGRLRDELEATLQEVRDSRVRIIEAGIVARRKIERDLHDGSQQSLVSLALSLRMAIGKARAEGADDLAADLEAALAQLTDALRELRELARGIHPSSLAVGGLGMAIDELAGRSTIPVDVSVDAPEHLPQLTESTLYFFVAECLTNIAKYAEATRARVHVSREDGGLTVAVADDGRGGADMTRGTGIQGLADRMAALGGSVELESESGRGTTITARIPASALVDAPVVSGRPAG